MYFSKLASKLMTTFPSENPGTICPLPNFSSFASSLELSLWLAKGRLDPTSVLTKEGGGVNTCIKEKKVELTAANAGRTLVKTQEGIMAPE